MLPWRGLTKGKWMAAYRAARLCKRGEVQHKAVNMLAKYYALREIVRPETK